MRSLCIAEKYPWPAVDGYKLRLANMIGGLLETGPVDFVCLDAGDLPRDPAPDGVTVIDAPEGPEAAASAWVPSWLRSSQPRRLVRRDFGAGRRAVAALDRAAYDLVFFSHVDSWHPTHDAIAGVPALLDFDNLENLLARGIRRLGPAIEPGDGLGRRAVARARWLVASAANLTDERRWDKVQRRAATLVEKVFVCSELDVERSGCPNAVVVPNGYELAWEPADHVAVADPEAPVFLFVGLMSYDPNIDGARWFARDVFPAVRARVPGARVRIVGRRAELVGDLASLPGVEVVGDVESLEPEMAGADVVVVPLRSGAGTRLKVVEAMANRLPMVSTTIGCEGIDVRHGEHLLIGDDARRFAEHCVTLATDPEQRGALIEAAAVRYDERYRWSTIRATVADLARSTASVQHR